MLPVRRIASSFTARLALACTALLVAAAPAIAARPHAAPAKAVHAEAIDPDAFNSSEETPLLKPGARGLAVARAQILLDRAWYSVGEIDGRYAANMERIVRAYQLARGLRETGSVTPETWQALRQDAAPLLTRYTVTDQDARGPFEKMPRDVAARAQLRGMPYESLEEALAERFHASRTFLRQLNPRIRLEAGAEIVVPNVAAGAPAPKGASIEIVKSRRVLYVLDAQKRPVAAFPVSMGNERRDPLPIGVMSIRTEVKNPRFTYNPALLKSEPRNAPKVDLPPGPNNPVGTIWLGLSKPHWGIHGTADPSNVGHSETNGCVHLTNWDAERLSLLARPGFRVDVRP